MSGILRNEKLRTLILAAAKRAHRSLFRLFSAVERSQIRKMRALSRGHCVLCGGGGGVALFSFNRTGWAVDSELSIKARVNIWLVTLLPHKLRSFLCNLAEAINTNNNNNKMYLCTTSN
jgi:hypothetical protein